MGGITGTPLGTSRRAPSRRAPALSLFLDRSRGISDARAEQARRRIGNRSHVALGPRGVHSQLLTTYEVRDVLLQAIKVHIDAVSEFFEGLSGGTIGVCLTVLPCPHHRAGIVHSHMPWLDRPQLEPRQLITVASTPHIGGIEAVRHADRLHPRQREPHVGHVGPGFTQPESSQAGDPPVAGCS